jgi:Putative zinc-finger
VSCPREADVGAYVLDALEPEERAGVAAHLSECTVCTRTLTELGTLPPLLTTVTPEDMHHEEPVPTDLAFHRLRRSAVGPARRRRHPWLLAVAAAGVVAAGGVGTGVAVMTSASPAPTTVAASSADVHAWATIKAAGAGSRITLTMNGVPHGATCWLVAVGRDGERDRTPSWVAGYEGDVAWSGTVALTPDQLSHLDVVTGDGRTIVSLPA